MECLENENVCSVKKENTLGYYRLHTIWKNDGFFINITSKEGAWRGEMTASDVNNISKQLDMEPQAYLNECKTALTCHDGLPGMTYAVENGTFTWKKVLDEDSGIKIKMGSVMLQPASFVETIQNLVTAALDCNKRLQKEVSALSKSKDELELKKNELMRTIEEMIKTKDMMEDDLYSKFALLLNTKKRRIAEMEALLREKNKSKETEKETEQTTHSAYNADTEEDYTSDDSDGTIKKSTSLKSQNKGRRSPFFGESSKETEPYCDRDTTDDEVSVSSPKIPKSSVSEESTQKVEKKKNMPSTKDEILDFFYGSS